MAYSLHETRDWLPPWGLEDAEAALASGNLFAVMGNSGRVWEARRNGATKTWKREPDRYRIPVKAGLRSYGEVTPSTLQCFLIRPR